MVGTVERPPRIGVLGAQGDYEAHRRTLKEIGIEASLVRSPADLTDLDGLILPGGESGAHIRILRENGLYQALRVFHSGGGALYGTCAGLILLARNVEGPAQESLGLIDLDVLRNGYGRQIDSFEADAAVGPGHWGTEPFRMVFIRAPRITRVGPGVEILLRHGDEPVAAREGRVLITSFHPEMTDDLRLHRYFVEEVVGSRPA